MTDQQKITPVTGPLIPRLNGDGVYQEGDRVLAMDVAKNELRAGIVGAISSDKKSDYLIVQFGEEPFQDYFLAQRDDVRDDLPDPEDAEQLVAWLESGA